MTTRILILPADPASAATCLEAGDGGRVLSRATLAPGAAAPAMPAATRSVLVVPGDAVRIDRIELPAHSAAQARAAARVLIAERLAHPAALHVVVDAGAAGTSLRTVAAVDPALLHGWLARAAASGVRPDAAVPEQLLLPDHDDTVHVLDAGDRWLARGAGLAFSAAPGLAARVLADRASASIDDGFEALAAARAPRPEVDLLQDAFAPASARAKPAGRRRLAWLAAAALASPLVLAGAQALRLELAARALESRAAAAVQAAFPGAGDEGPEALRARLQAAREPADFVAASGALFAAVASRPGTHLAGLEYQRGDRLRAVLVHDGADDLEALRGALAADGWRLVEGGGSEVPGGLRTGLVLEPGA